MEWLKFARAREENFGDLCPKLEEWKKNVIGGHKWH